MAVATSTAQLLQELRALADGAGAMPPAAIADALQRLASCFRDAASGKRLHGVWAPHVSA